MASKKTAFAVGLFMIVGLTLAVIAIIWLGMSNYFEKGRNYVAYFDESVQGLDKDSPVKYRGVSVGRVKSVRLAPDATLIEVLLTIEQDVKLESDMVGQLKSVGITGIMFIEIDRKKEGEPDYLPKISFGTDYPILRTRPSGIKMLMDGMDAVLSLVNELDTKGISNKVKSGFDKISQAVEEARFKEISANIQSVSAKIDAMLDVEKWNKIIASVENTAQSLDTLTANADRTLNDIRKDIGGISANANKTVLNINNTVTDVDRIIAKNEKELTAAISDFKGSVKNIDTFMKQGAGLIQSSDVKVSALQRHLLVTLQNLEKASENLNNLLEHLSEQPSQLIFGEPVPSKKSE